MTGDTGATSGLGDTTVVVDPGSPSTGSPGSGTSESSTEGGAVFIVDDPDAGKGGECDLFAQDCPPGEKCMPWANDGGNSWNATICSPVAETPGQAGDACSVEGSGVSGVDDCDLGAMCWDVNPEDNTGTCVAMCTGDSSNPFCEDPNTTCVIANEGVLVLCLPVCDPLLQNCPEGQACYPVEEKWSCAPDVSGEGGVYGDPCEYINVCNPGLMCLDSALVPGCAGAIGCCSEVCDTSDPAGDAQCTGAGEGQVCTPWYDEGAAPPGYETVGACVLPG